MQKKKKKELSKGDGDFTDVCPESREALVKKGKSTPRGNGRGFADIVRRKRGNREQNVTEETPEEVYEGKSTPREA